MKHDTPQRWAEQKGKKNSQRLTYMKRFFGFLFLSYQHSYISLMNQQLLPLFLEWNKRYRFFVPGSSWRSLWFSKQLLYFSPIYYVGTSKPNLWECGHMIRKQAVIRHSGTCLYLQHLGRQSSVGWPGQQEISALQNKTKQKNKLWISSCMSTTKSVVWSSLGVVQVMH